MWCWKEYHRNRMRHLSGVMLYWKDGLALVSDKELRVNKADLLSSFWKRAVRVPLADWPDWRDEQLGRLMDEFRYFPIWQTPDGKHYIRASVSVRKQGDEVIIPLGDVEYHWVRGEVPPRECIHTLEDLVRLWDVMASWCRREMFMRLAGHIPSYEDERKLFDVACYARWEEALRLVEEVGARQEAADYARMLLSPARRNRAR